MKSKNNITRFAYLFVIFAMLASEAIYEHVYPWWDNFFKIGLFVLSLPCISKLPSSVLTKFTGYLLTFFLIMLLWTVGGASLYMAVSIMFKLAPVLLFVLYMAYKHVDLLRITYNVLFLLVSISLLFYILFDLEIINVTPKQYIWELSDGYQYIYTDYLGIYYRWHRNRSVLGYDFISGNGLWHEPGAYQIYANLGLYLALFVYNDFKKEKYRFIRPIVFIAAVISSTSTMGLLLLTIILFIKSSHAKYAFKPFVLITLLIQGIGIIIALMSEKMLSGSYMDRSSNTTGGLEYFFSSPLFGHDVGSEPLYSGILSYLVIWGILGLFPFYIFLKGVFNNSLGKDLHSHIAIVTWYVLCMMDENYAYYPIIFLIYGICIFYKKQCFLQYKL